MLRGLNAKSDGDGAKRNKYGAIVSTRVLLIIRKRRSNEWNNSSNTNTWETSTDLLAYWFTDLLLTVRLKEWVPVYKISAVNEQLNGKEPITCEMQQHKWHMYALQNISTDQQFLCGLLTFFQKTLRIRLNLTSFCDIDGARGIEQLCCNGYYSCLLSCVYQHKQVYSAHKEHGETNMENRLNVTTMHPSELLNHIHKFNMSNSFYLSLSASMFVISASHSLHAGEVMWCRDRCSLLHPSSSSLNLYGTRT